MNMYIQNSFIMDGDYTAKKEYTVESEAHVFSRGKVNPMQYRFKQSKTDPLSKAKRMRFSKKSLKKSQK